MNSLRVRVALILVLSNFLVLCLATALSLFIVAHVEPTTFYERLATQVTAIDNLAAEISRNPQPGSAVMPAPTGGENRDRMTEALKAALLERGADIKVVISEPVDSARPVASILLNGLGWFAFPIPSEPPSHRFRVTLIGWTAMAMLGTAVMSLYLAHRTTLPLRVLEQISNEVSAKGHLPPMPSEGPAEVRAMTQALNRLAGGLKTAMESRMRLVAAAGHDFRTPLTRMRLRAEFLNEDERSHWLRDLDELQAIADSAISLVREEVTLDDAKSIRIDQLAMEVCEELKAIGLRIEQNDIAIAVTDAKPEALRRALRNLIINAATHGGGAHVTLLTKDDKILVLIEDEGPGIPEPMIDRVFEPFFRVDPARRKQMPGAGLGLAIAKEILERHGGTLCLKNRPEGGLVQIIKLKNSPSFELPSVQKRMQ
jgi:signal transduction histidine kinase